MVRTMSRQSHFSALLRRRRAARGGSPDAGALARGFTLVELMIVIAVLSILLAISVPIYQTTILHAREAVLRDDLFQMRSLINQYTLDKHQAPQSLDDLVTAGYLRKLPVDPFTNSNTTWQPVQDNSMMSIDETQPGIVDVHSGSDAISSQGTPYSSW